jgi:hypothetical protein
VDADALDDRYEEAGERADLDREAELEDRADQERGLAATLREWDEAAGVVPAGQTGWPW